MALNIFGASSNAVKFFEVRVDSNVIVLRGADHEAQNQLVKGTVVLCVSESMSFRSIHLELLGTSRVASPDSTPNRTSKSKQEKMFFVELIQFMDAAKGKDTLDRGNYEFPFEIEFPGHMPESLEGLYDSWIVYKLKATIERGKFAHNLHARKHLRVVRTLDPSSLELVHSMSVENVWPNKLEYSISIPSKAAIFGTSIPIDFKLIPLLKGLKIGKISVRLMEHQEFSLPDRVFTSSRQVVSADYSIPEQSEEEMDEAQIGFDLSERLVLPKTLAKCVQDVDCKGIKVRHKLKFTVQLHNPDGHTSELRATLPVYIFISPRLPLDENNQIIEQFPNEVQTLEDLSQHAPPLYGEHQFDRLWDEVDPAGYMTPGAGASGVGTPYLSRSRNPSSEQLASLDGVADDAIGPAELHSRLRNLPESSSTFWHRSRQGAMESGGHTPASTVEQDLMRGTQAMNIRAQSSGNEHGGVSRRSSDGSDSNTVSRRVSQEETIHSHSPEFSEMDANILSKVPSYKTAVKATAMTPLRDGLPTYDSATGIDTVPIAAMPRRPSPTRRPSPQRSPSESHGSSPTAALFSRIAHTNSFLTRHGGNDDQERHFRLMQARSRAQ